MSRVDAVLLRPSHAGNIGAAARALKVMGWRNLVVVDAREPGFATDPQAVAFSSGAHDLLSAACVHSTLQAALAPSTLAIAVSAAGREFAPPPLDPESAADAALAELLAHPSHRVAFVFGTERTGLSIADAQRCQRLLSIPTAADYGSLNLAQAVQVVAYVVRRRWLSAPGRAEGDAMPSSPAPDALQAGGASRALDARRAFDATGARESLDAAHAPIDAVEGLFAHLEQALIDIDFLDPASPKRLMPRLRRLLARTRLERAEVDILRGICTAMQARAAAARAANLR